MTNERAKMPPLTEQSVLENLENYDFIDVGANKGDSFRFGIEALGGKSGLALDINPDAVAKLRQAGIPALERDCRSFDFGNSSFRFAIFSHILEHMPSSRDVIQLLMGASRNVTDFIFIRQPFFDEVAYLSTLGIKTVGTNLSYHPMHMSSMQYASLLMTADFYDFAIYGSERLHNSHASAKIIATDSPHGTKGWKRDPATKPPLVTFTKPIYRELAILIRLSESDIDPILLNALPKRELLFKSRRKFDAISD